MNPDMYGVEILHKDFKRYTQCVSADGTKSVSNINLRKIGNGEILATHTELERRHQELYWWLQKIKTGENEYSSFNG